MVKELVIYPDDRIVMCGEVRDFHDKSLPRLIGDMQETMEANGLDALSAIQVAHPFKLVLIKEGERYREYINLRILEKAERAPHRESTSYLPGISYELPRYRRIKIFYEDRHGEAHYETVDDPERAATLQRMLDFLGGATPLFRLPRERREAVLRALEGKGLYRQEELCPAFSRKDYFISFTDKILFLMGLSLLTPLCARWFRWSTETAEKIYLFDKIAFPAIIALMIAYFFYAQFEAKKYKQCSSCQIGNQIGIIIKRFVVAFAFALGAWLLVNPSSPLFD